MATATSTRHRRHPLRSPRSFPSSYGFEITSTDSYSPLLPLVSDCFFIDCWFSVGAPSTLLADLCQNAHSPAARLP